MTGQRIGYKRVSTIDQNTARQLDGVPLDKFFEDKASGKDTNRPQLQAALGYCREGDTLVVHSMDRLARSLVDHQDGLRRQIVVASPKGADQSGYAESVRKSSSCYDSCPTAVRFDWPFRRVKRSFEWNSCPSN